MNAPAGRPDSVMDVAAIPVADAYARAVMDLLPEAPQAEELAEELEAARDLLEAQEGVTQLLVLAPIGPHARQSLVRRAFGGRCSRVLEGLLCVLARKDRLGLLGLVAARFRRLLDHCLGRRDVTVTTAVGLDESERNRLAEGLAETLGIRPVLHVRVDPDLVAGMVVAVEGRVYDASVGLQLDRMRLALLAGAAADHAEEPRADRGGQEAAPGGTGTPQA